MEYSKKTIFVDSSDETQIKEVTDLDVIIGQTVRFSFKLLLEEGLTDLSDEYLNHMKKYNNTQWVIKEVHYDIRSYLRTEFIICWVYCVKDNDGKN